MDDLASWRRAGEGSPGAAAGRDPCGSSEVQGASWEGGVDAGESGAYVSLAVSFDLVTYETLFDRKPCATGR